MSVGEGRVAPARLSAALVCAGLGVVLASLAAACGRDRGHACERLGALCSQRDVVYRVGDSRWAGATADLDGDGQQDLVVAIPEFGLSIRWGTSEEREDRLYPGAAGVALADLDGDGDTDVVLVADGALRVLDNVGGRALPETRVLVLEGQPESLWVGAVDGDASPDVIVGTSAPGGLEIFTHGLERRARASFGQALAAVEVADLEGDGALDIVAADFADSALYVVPANGGGEAVPVRSDAGPAPEQLQLLDLDGDGKLEASTHGRSAAEIWVHAGIGGGAFGPPTTLASLDVPSSGFAVHRDGRGVPWLLFGADGRLVAGELDASGRVVRRVMTGFYFGVTGVTLDGDFALTRSAGGFEHYALEPSHTFAELWCSEQFFGSWNVPLALGDFTQDGLVDVAAAMDDSAVTIFAGQPDGTWQEFSSFEVPSKVFRMAAGDVTGDGRVDLVLGEGALGLAIAVGQGDGSFVAGAPVPTRVSIEVMHVFAPSEAGAVAIADERDAAEQGVDVLTFDGAGNRVGEATPIAGGYAERLASADVDGDGREELVALVLDGTDASLVIAPPEGDGWGAVQSRSLAELSTMLGGESFRYAGLGVGDLDRDGAVDAVLVVRGAIVRLPDLGAGAPPQMDAAPEVSGARFVAVAHADDDGIPDVVFHNYGDFHVALGTEGGELRVQAPFSEEIQSPALFVEPVNLRAIGAYSSDRGISVLTPGIAPSLALNRSFDAPGLPVLLEAGDLDADGVTDLVVSEVSDGLSGGVNVFLGSGEGPPRVAAGRRVLESTHVISVVNLDDQRGDEILAASVDTFEVLLVVNGALKAVGRSAVDVSSIIGLGALVRPGEPSDVVALGRIGDSTLRLIARPRAERDLFDAWEAPVLLWEGQSGASDVLDSTSPMMATADLDGDGFTDVALYPGGGEPVRVVWGDPERTAPMTEVALGAALARALAVGDLDGDGQPELAIATEDDIVRVELSGRSPGEPVSLGWRCGGELVLADLEGDGMADLLCADFLMGVSLVLRAPGREDAGFWIAVTEGLEWSWRSMRAVELDGDGILDLVGLRDDALVMRLSGGGGR